MKALMNMFEHECEGCGYQWRSLIARPIICPNCKASPHVKDAGRRSADGDPEGYGDPTERMR